MSSKNLAKKLKFVLSQDLSMVASLSNTHNYYHYVILPPATAHKIRGLLVLSLLLTTHN